MKKPFSYSLLSLFIILFYVHGTDEAIAEGGTTINPSAKFVNTGRVAWDVTRPSNSTSGNRDEIWVAGIPIHGIHPLINADFELVFVITNNEAQSGILEVCIKEMDDGSMDCSLLFISPSYPTLDEGDTENCPFDCLHIGVNDLSLEAYIELQEQNGSPLPNKIHLPFVIR